MCVGEIECVSVHVRECGSMCVDADQPLSDEPVNKNNSV